MEGTAGWIRRQRIAEFPDGMPNIAGSPRSDLAAMAEVYSILAHSDHQHTRFCPCSYPRRRWL